MWIVLKPEFVARLPRHGANGSLPKGVATLQLTECSITEWDNCMKALTAFRDYQRDWDGQGAEAPTAELIESASRLATMIRDAKIDPPSCVVPGVNGTVILEWQFDDGTYLEIEITEPHRAEAVLIAPGHATEHWVLQ